MDVEPIIDDIEHFRKCLKHRMQGHSVRSASVLPIEGTMKCSRIVLGFGWGSTLATAVKPRLRCTDSDKSIARTMKAPWYEKQGAPKDVLIVGLMDDPQCRFRGRLCRGVIQ